MIGRCTDRGRIERQEIENRRCFKCYKGEHFYSLIFTLMKPMILNSTLYWYLQAAIEEGVVIGGGCCLLRLSMKIDVIKKTLENEEQKVLFP